jgi:sodium/bile acid cotransporter 7
MLGITALLPIIIGQIISYIWTEKMMWAKTKFYFAELNTIALLIMIWTVLSDLFQSGLLKTVYTSDLLIIILLNAVLFIVFTLLALFLARLPNIFVCRKRTINSDHQPLIPEHQSKSPTLIERWRFSRENTITFMFCGSTKALSLGIPIITAVYTNYSSGFIGLLAVPLILYDVEQMIICSIEIILLQRFFK